MKMPSNAIELEDVQVKLKKEIIIDRLSLQVKKGQFLALLGPSGVGKTTLLRTIAGFVEPSEGIVNIFEKNVNGTPPESRHISMLFQDPVLFKHFTVEKNALIGFLKKNYQISQKAILNDLASKFQIEDCLKKKINEGISGGEKQRAALLRTFAHAQKILLLDEPLKSALNLNLRWQLMKTIKDLGREQNRTTILVTHDFEEAAYLADEIAIITGKGRKIHKGKADQMYHYPPNLEVAKVLGMGTEINAEFIYDKNLREEKCPFRFEDQIPKTNNLVKTFFIRPNCVSIDPRASGFIVKDIIFMGEYSLIELFADTPDKEDPIEVISSVPSILSNTMEIGEKVGLKISTKDLIAFDEYRERIEN